MQVTSLSIGQFIIEYLDNHEQEHARNEYACLFPFYTNGSKEFFNSSVETVKEPLLSSSPTSYEPSFALHPYPAYRSSSARSYPYSDISSTSSVSLANETTVLGASSLTEPSRDQQGPFRRPRSRSKPTSIFIHPTQSNIARADAAAIHLGLAGDTEMVKGNMYATEGDPAWKIGSGKDLARQIMSRSSTL